MRVRSALLAVFLCGLVSQNAHAQNAGAPAIAVPVQVAGVAVRVVGAGEAFRWSDGDWVVRVNAQVTNTTGMPVQFHPRMVACSGGGRPMNYWAPAASFNGPRMLAPGETATGTLAWFYSRNNPQPVNAMVQAPGTPPQMVPVFAVGQTTAVAAPVVVPVGSAVSVVPQGPGEAFRWSDGDWVFRVPVQVSNGTPGLVMFQPSAVRCAANGLPMTFWSSAATLNSPQQLPPGGVVRGTLAWYYSGSNPQPTSAVLQAPGMPPQQVMATGLAVAVPVQQPVPVVAAPSSLSPAVQFRYHPRAQVFRWSDGDWIARVHVNITNGGPVPVEINPVNFDATGNGMSMTDWSSAATLNARVVLQPGQSTNGTIAWYYNRNNPPPSSIAISYQGAPWAGGNVFGVLVPGGEAPGAVQ